MATSKKNYNKISTEKQGADEIVKEGVTGTTSEKVEPKIPTLVGVVSNCKKLNVRKNPDLEAKVLKVIDENDEVEVIEGTDTKDFYEIKIGKTKGFCMKKYIKLK